jgi:Rps23 Pro-64 3,4-dihydroxylase Tpa1-like proline 4-hydroxylase
MINKENLQAALASFKGTQPFEHCVIDDFFEKDIALALSKEFLPYESEKWFYYKNPLENKKALNDWNAFPPLTYRAFSYLNSREFIDMIEGALDLQLHADNGLHGGGWHMHAAGGNLNPHLDYSIHPKMGLQRKLNLIVYLSGELEEQHGGHLGMWSHDSDASKPQELVKEVQPRFNRALLFDTTQNSWHGMSRPLSQPENIFRKSFAVYYLCVPVGDVDPRGRALYAARENQVGDAEVERIIELRAKVDSSSKVYKTD